jgi:SAM-dependent methyltransferase
MKASGSSFHTVTEKPGLKATREQLERIYHRYRFAADYARAASVLEVACGAGIGLGYLACAARRVVGGDIDEVNLEIAKGIYRDWARGEESAATPEIIWLDAHELTFPDGSFDLLLLFEAIYYLAKPELFVAEAKRVLNRNGRLIIGTVNKDWADFHPSPYTHRYFSVPELYELLRRDFSSVVLYGGFSIPEPSRLQMVVSALKRIAVRLNLIPGSLAARTYLKRLFLGPLRALPAQLQEGMTDYEPPVAISAVRPDRDHKIIYAVATNGRT